MTATTLWTVLTARFARLGGRVRRSGRRLLQAAVLAIVARLTAVAGRDDDLWVFGARGGRTVGENSKYLFLHVAAECPDVRAVWVAHDDDVVRTLRERGYEAHRAGSLQGRLLQLRAGVVFLTHNFDDVDWWSVGGALTVMLWHGSPLKYISWDAELRDLPWPVDAAMRSMYERYDVVLATSEATLGPIVSGFRLPYHRFAPVGYPRTDAFLGDVPDADVGVDAGAMARFEELDGDVVLYLPTYREVADDRPTTRLDEDALARLDETCARRGAHLVYKTHPQESLEVDLDPYPRVHRFSEGCDVYPLLPHTDVLVTDYSSVYLEYLLLDRPVVFYPYDLARYRERRGLYYDYDAVTPGPRATDLDGLCATLDRTLAGEDEYESARERVRDRFFDVRDGERSAAVAELIRRRLDGE